MSTYNWNPQQNSGGGGGSSYTFADSIVNSAGTVTLVGDSASPAASQYYGTDGGSVLGYHTLTAGGSVTSISVVSANGLAGTVATATTTPAITISTTVNSPVLAGNGTALIAATVTGTGSTAVLAQGPTIDTTILTSTTLVNVGAGFFEVTDSMNSGILSTGSGILFIQPGAGVTTISGPVNINASPLTSRGTLSFVGGTNYDTSQTLFAFEANASIAGTSGSPMAVFSDSGSPGNYSSAGVILGVNNNPTTFSTQTDLVDFQIDSNSKFKIDTNGDITLGALGAGVLQASSVGLISSTAPGTSGNVLTSNGTAWVSMAGGGGGSGTVTSFSFTNGANATGTVTNSTTTPTLSLAPTSATPAASSFASWDASKNMSASGFLLNGSSSGIISILPQAAAGTYNFNLPITAGTAGQVLTSQGGGSSAMTWTAVGGSGTVTSVATGTGLTGGTITTTGTISLASIANNTVLGNTSGGSAAPTVQSLGTVTESTSSVLTLTGWANATIGSPTIQVAQASGSVSGYLSSTDWTTFNGKGSGTVTAVSVASANGFAGSSSGGATPALTLTTSITGVLKGNGTAISAATSGTDYSAGTSSLATGIVKSTTTTGTLTIAIAADFPTLNQNTTGLAATATAPASGSAHGAVVLNSSGNFTSVAPSTSGNILTSNGTDWISQAAGGGSGTVTNFLFTNAANVTGAVATSTTTPTLSLAPTGTSAVASSFAAWDANSNLAANNHFNKYTTTVTSASPVTLTVASTYNQYFTGSTAQTVKMPDATTMVQTGAAFRIVNNSNQTMTIQDNSAGAIQSIFAGGQALLTVTNIGSAAGTWDFSTLGSFIGWQGDGTLFSSTIARPIVSGAGTNILLNPLSQTANLFYASPVSGASAAPTFRKIGSTDFVAANSSNSWIQNFGLATSVAASAMTITTKQNDGSTNQNTGLSASSIGFRSATATSGAYTIVSMTSASTLTIASGATLGQQSATNQYIWVYLLNNAGSAEIAVSGVKMFDDHSIQSTTAMSGSATSGTVLYSTSARTNVPIRLVGRLLVNESTAGTWASNATEVALVVSSTPVLTAPTVQSFTSGSGTYTAPTSPSPLYIKVTMVGGGGGGAGNGTSPGTPATGNNSTFGSSLLSAVGGGAASGNSGGSAGTASLGSGPIGIALTGGTGQNGPQNGLSALNFAGGDGGQTALGGAGVGAPGGGFTGSNGSANTGAGGGGASGSASLTSSGGGGSGGYISAIITNPLATYSYVVGGTAAGGTAGSGGAAGGNGAAGYIIVEEFYQ